MIARKRRWPRHRSVMEPGSMDLSTIRTSFVARNSKTNRVFSARRARGAGRSGDMDVEIHQDIRTPSWHVWCQTCLYCAFSLRKNETFFSSRPIFYVDSLHFSRCLSKKATAPCLSTSFVTCKTRQYFVICKVESAWKTATANDSGTLRLVCADGQTRTATWAACCPAAVQLLSQWDPDHLACCLRRKHVTQKSGFLNQV